MAILFVDQGLYGRNIWTTLPAYVAIALEAIMSTVIDNTSISLTSTVGNAPLAMLSSLGAWSLSLVVNTLLPSVRFSRIV